VNFELEFRTVRTDINIVSSYEVQCATYLLAALAKAIIIDKKPTHPGAHRLTILRGSKGTMVESDSKEGGVIQRVCSARIYPVKAVCAIVKRVVGLGGAGASTIVKRIGRLGGQGVPRVLGVQKVLPP
jgi:hypothetical protein